MKKDEDSASVIEKMLLKCNSNESFETYLVSLKEVLNREVKDGEG